MKVLLVDDDKNSRNAMRWFLQRSMHAGLKYGPRCKLLHSFINIHGRSTAYRHQALKIKAFADLAMQPRLLT